MWNEKEIAIIIYIDNEQYEAETLDYIHQLIVPEGYQLDVLSIKEVDSIAKGYQEAMEASCAKYKIYLHQNVFLIYPQFLAEALHIFENKKIGMIGVMGQKKLSAYENLIGRCYISDEKGISLFTQGIEQERKEGTKEPYIDVEIIENFFIMTQYDISWNEEFEEGENFYAILHSIKMKQNGYRIVIPSQKEVWCLYDWIEHEEKDSYQAEQFIIRLQR